MSRFTPLLFLAPALLWAQVTVVEDGVTLSSGGGGGLTEVTAGDVNSEASTDGQILTSDGLGNAAWEDAGGLMEVTAGDVNSEASTDGQVLTSDGASGAGWETVGPYLSVTPGGTTGFSTDPLLNGPDSIFIGAPDNTGAFSNMDRGVVIGADVSYISGQDDVVVIGHGASVYVQGVAIGKSATAGQSGVTIGMNASTGNYLSPYGIAIGYDSDVSGLGSVGLGRNMDVSSNYQMRAGYNNIDWFEAGASDASGTDPYLLTTVMKLTPQSTPPSSPSLGWIYVDSDDSELYYYNGSAWEQISP